MPKLHSVVVRLALLSALALAGCGDTVPQRLAKLKAGLASGEPKKIAAATIELKSLLQKQPKSSAARFLLGTHLLSSGDATAAAIELQRSLELGHPASDVMPLLARAMLKLGKSDQVVAQFKAERLDVPLAQADLMSSVALALATRGDVKGATELLANTLLASPDSPQALLALARIDGSAGKPNEALATVEMLLKRAPDSAEAWALKGDLHSLQPGGRDAARQAFAEATKRNPNDTHVLLSSITLSLSAGDLKAANETFKLLKKRAPDQAATGVAEANIAYAGGDHAKAREVFQALLRALPENVTILLGAGENELRLGSAQQAEAHLAKASSLAPANPVARRLLAQAQLTLGQPQKALLTLGPVISARDATPEALALAAEAHLVNGDTKAAEALYGRVASLKPADPKLRTAIAMANFGRVDDQRVFDELADIARTDKGTWADLALVNAHVRRGQVDRAIVALDTIERKRPGDPMAQHLRGQLLVGQNKLAEGRASFEKALALNKTYFPSIAALAALDMREGKADAAQKRFTDVIKSQPANMSAKLGLAEILVKQGAPEKKVIAQIEAAVKAAPQNVEARMALIEHHFERSNIDAALNAARAAAAAMPDNTQVLEVLAKCQLRAQQISQALSTYGKIAALLPKSPDAYLGMAEIYLNTDELAAAERSINRSLELSPGLPQARSQAIMLAIKRQQFPQAIEIAKQMQAEQPGIALGFLLEGEIESRRARWSAAAAAFQAAINKQAPGSAPLKLYQVLVKGDRRPEAEAFATRWMKQHPRDAAFMFLVAEAAQSRGDLANAERGYRQVLGLRPEHVGALNNLAMMLAEQKKPEAVTLAERAVMAAPGRAVILDTLAFARASSGKLAEAIEAQRQAVTLAPTEGQFRFSLAKLLVQAGKPALAHAELTKLLEQGGAVPDRAKVKQLLASLR